MGIVYILSILILLIDNGTYRYCYRYYVVQKDIWKNVKCQVILLLLNFSNCIKVLQTRAVSYFYIFVSFY